MGTSHPPRNRSVASFPTCPTPAADHDVAACLPVHYPIGLLSISFGLDALQLAPLLTSGLTWLKVMPPAAVVNTLSHYTGAAGLLSAIPTLLSGLAEL